MENKVDLESIKNLIKQNPNILGAYLYGSYAKETQGINSDIDIAVFGNNIYIKDLYDLLDKLQETTQKKVDLINLDNNLESMLGFQVIKYGKLLFTTDEHVKNKIQSRYALKYFDDEAFRNRLSKNLNKKLGII